jgi:AraC-like DNA-binding protein
MLTSTLLQDDALVRIRLVACREAARGLSPIETATSDSIVFPLRGAFVKHFSPSCEVVAEPNVAIFFADGRSHRVSHPAGDCDDCLSLSIAPELLREMLATEAEADSLHEIEPQAVLSAPMLARRALLVRHRSVEDALLMVGDALRAARKRPVRRMRAATRAKRREQAEATRFTLLAHPEKPWSLTALARRVHTSPYHLAHLFRAEVGLTVHGYLTRARLLRALERIGDEDLTEVALDCGFSSHSHFTSTFRRFLGRTPSQLRKDLTATVSRDC